MDEVVAVVDGEGEPAEGGEAEEAGDLEATEREMPEVSVAIAPRIG